MYQHYLLTPNQRRRALPFAVWALAPTRRVEVTPAVTPGPYGGRNDF